MASLPAQNTTKKPRPEKGDALIVIHDFIARGNDELTLRRGDRVELTERDDDFGDGWYLGRHLSNGSTGLFPEVYTQLAESNSNVSTVTSIPQSQRIPVASAPNNPFNQPERQVQPIQQYGKTGGENGFSRSMSDLNLNNSPRIQQPSSDSERPQIANNAVTIAPTMVRPDNIKLSGMSSMPPTSALPNLPKKVAMATSTTAGGQESPVMHETLSVIDEHITDMKSPRSGVLMEYKAANDSGSDYSSLLDHHRLSYINGEETDEELDPPTRAEVLAWSPDQVAEYLFTAGVEQKHCEVLRDEDFSGEVLMGMEQSTLQMSALDLGSVGRRLKTWLKIKALQDDVCGSSTQRNTSTTYGSEHGSENPSRRTSRNMTTSIPRLPSLVDRPGSRQNTHHLLQQSFRPEPVEETSSVSPLSNQGSPGLGQEVRPSAASIREFQHVRQGSITAFSLTPLTSVDGATEASSSRARGSEHKKKSSFDRNWTMHSAGASSRNTSSRPLSSAGLTTSSQYTTEISQSTAPSSPFATERGYLSGGETESRNRNVLRKRTSGAPHSRNSSYSDEQRNRSATAHTRHSRLGSVDSIRDAPHSAVQKYYGTNGRRRTPSESSINPSSRPLPPPKDVTSPIVTKLEGMSYPDSSSAKSPVSLTLHNGPADWFLPSKQSSNRFGLRAISDVVTGHERSRLRAPTEPQVPTPPHDSPLESPSRADTERSIPSGGPSIDLASPEIKPSGTMTSMHSARTNRKKTKKETSAYTRGLETKSPAEQMATADYSGWMKKKSSNLMTTWKSRLFILRGQRLSYYYSEDDTQEKGLIDISFHRVLPADGDKLTGLHAALTGANNSPTSPPGSIAPTMASVQAAAEPSSTLNKGSGGESIFIFKLVPPKAGLPKAVAFTKPTVHYFAVPNVQQGRLWMAALMRATIERDESRGVKSSYQQKTISLAKARAMRHRPPALMNLDENPHDGSPKTPASDSNGLKISGMGFDKQTNEEDSGVSGVTKSETALRLNKTDSENTNALLEKDDVSSPGVSTL